ncbi:MAG TPA: enoyl-CoA hydratase/isomerase family protein [Spirochaetota bacterium]|jgi:enoyl-CoA hydratase|nr:enoyl-CoA hydratase/isomerase family protein [Spirochaetota bacterium]OQA96334.1 MAG: putative enoyl-CoA hydratase echA8 [Spirochaetes bacterium ADurb.Bin218]HOK02785.1 enoyl-CoA hydratase/isomerase family protein [Spirochaetota bacterium]HOK92978.1 enoyl-CoA hydratase/isomerase family protein [Spirochaetota bacterium]HON16649.1 enoyl-CoA hydratase/isomerase family protein [Spirochaetota bacterium]
MEDIIALEFKDRIAFLTLCDPKGLNLENLEMVKVLAEKQEEIDRNKEIRAVVVQSSVKNFSAGAALTFLQDVNSRFIKDNLNFLQRAFSRFQELPIPVICAINGICYGGGLELALSCDIRIASRDAKFSMPEVRFGFTADQTGTTRLAKLLGIGNAKKMILLCEEIDAEEAYRIGLVEYLVEKEELHSFAEKLAKRVASFPPSGVRFGKIGVNVAAEGNTYASLMFEQAQSIYCFGTEDKEEAVKSFMEKRKGVFNDK